MFRRLLPKETNFFDHFEAHSAHAIDACKEFLQLASSGSDILARAARIKEIEEAADVVTHRCTESLHKTFITPLDRSDIHLLIKRMDDIIDSVYAASSRIVVYEITEIRPEARELAEVLVEASLRIGEALRRMRNLKDAAAIQEICIAIHHLENRGDNILRSALIRLFKEDDRPILVIKWKEIYERLEKATDRCEDVADIIEKVVIEST
jgi:hypothetical protein